MPKITDERIAHMHGVAEYMYRNAEKYNLDKKEMYVLGLLHEIGYVYGKAEHEVYGARLLEKLGFKDSWLISWHGTPPVDFMKLKDISDVPNALILLWEADLSVNAKGEEVGFNKRLEDIGERLGFDSVAYRIASETVEWLRDDVR